MLKRFLLVPFQLIAPRRRFRRRWAKRVGTALGVPAIAALAVLTTRLVPGPQKDRTTLLPSGWRIRPAGRQVPVGTLPLNLLTLSDGSVLVTNNGYGRSEERRVGKESRERGPPSSIK